MTVEVVGWVPATDTFGARLALVRHRMNWNVKEAAIACELAPSSWRGWETTGARPQNYIEVCRAISKTSGCSYRWLVDGGSEGPGEGLPHLDSNQKPTGLRAISTASKASLRTARARPHAPVHAPLAA